MQERRPSRDGLVLAVPVMRPTDLSWLAALAPLARLIVIDDGVGVRRESLPPGAVLLQNALPLGVGRCLKQALNHALLTMPQSRGMVQVGDGQPLSPEALGMLADALDAHPLSVTIGYTPPEQKQRRGIRASFFASRLVFRIINGSAVEDVQAPVRMLPRDTWPAMLALSGEGPDYLLDQIMSINKSLTPLRQVVLPGRPVSGYLPLSLWVAMSGMLWRYLGASTAGVLSNYLIFMVLYYAVWPSITLCTVVAQITSMFVTYNVARKLVFSLPPSLGLLLRYFALTLVLMILNILLMSLFSDILHIPVILAKPLSEAIVYSGSYVLQRKIVFRTPKPKRQIDPS